MKWLILLLLLTVPGIAHEDAHDLEILGIGSNFIRPDSIYANEEISLGIIIEKNNTPFTGLEVQAQIMEMTIERDVFYAQAIETSPGIYEIKWTTLAPGDYAAQFLLKSDGEVIKPTFPFKVSNPILLRAILTILGLAIIGLSIYKKTWIGKIIGAAILLSVFFLGPADTLLACEGETCNVPLHWHANLEITQCGEDFFLPVEDGALNAQHTHDEENKIHLHSMVKTTKVEVVEKEKLLLSDLFEQSNIKFDKECLGDYCNGDVCPDGSEGKVSMTVNGEPNDEFENYPWYDEDNISISFE